MRFSHGGYMIGKREEEYLEAIYSVVEDKGYAKVTDVANELDVGLSAVTEMFQRLDDKGYIDYTKYSGVTLTSEGEKIAFNLCEKHAVLRDFFTILGLDEEVADEDACKIEHIVKPETLELLNNFVDFIQEYEEPPWLEDFREYCETGELEGSK